MDPVWGKWNIAGETKSTEKNFVLGDLSLHCHTLEQAWCLPLVLTRNSAVMHLFESVSALTVGHLGSGVLDQDSVRAGLSLETLWTLSLEFRKLSLRET